MSDREAPEIEPADDGFNVFFEPAHYRAEEIEAELPDGSRVASILQLGGRRLGFDQKLPAGTWILRRAQKTWGPVGTSE